VSRNAPTNTRPRVTSETGLLLAVAILLVCAGVPWWLEKRIRRGVNETQRHCTVILDALTAYYADHGAFPVPVSSSAGMHEEIEKIGFAVPLGFTALTSPVAYIHAAPKPPFRRSDDPFAGYWVATGVIRQATVLAAVLCAGPAGPILPELDTSEPTFRAFFADADGKIRPVREIWYDLSNGLLSPGWIYRDNHGNASLCP